MALLGGGRLVDIDRLGVRFLKGGQLILHHRRQTAQRKTYCVYWYTIGRTNHIFNV